MFVSLVVVLAGLGLPGDVTLFCLVDEAANSSLVYFWFL